MVGFHRDAVVQVNIDPAFAPFFHQRESKILEEKSGFINYSENDNEKIITYIRLNSIGWYYLAEANTRVVDQEPHIQDH